MIGADKQRCRTLQEADIPAGIIPRLRDVITEQPSKVAVTDQKYSLSYGTLAARAASILTDLRHNLAELVPPPRRFGEAEFNAHEPVALLFDHEVDAVAALVAVLASGHPVLVLDPRTPADRSQRLVRRVGARIVLTAPSQQFLAGELGIRVVVPEGDATHGDAAGVDRLWEDPPAADDVAVVAFTSGSTGEPKAVANPHEMLIRDAWNSSISAECYGDTDVFAHTLPIAFHAGLTATVHGLLVGVTMHLYDTRTTGIGQLASFIDRQGCTLMIASPAILRGFTATKPRPDLLTGLRQLTIAGEPAHARDVLPATAFLPPGCAIRNRYGCSETGLLIEYVVDPATVDGQLPAGRSVGRTVVEIVDAEGVPVPEGQVGRVRVSAPCFSLGYWGLPEQTAASFGRTEDGWHTYLTSDQGRLLPDGNYMIVGRSDHSVKIRGYLVDPGEVDAALFQIPGVREAVVVSGVRPHDQAIRLLAYVVLESDTDTGEAAVRSSLRGRLPAHMVPEIIVLLDELPRTERGKIDRKALPEPIPADDDDSEHLKTGWECLIAEHWAHVLCLDKTTLRGYSDFFALGGDSLSAEELMTRLINDVGVSPARAETRMLAETPTLRVFAARLLEDGPKDKRRWSLPLQSNGSRPPVFLVTGAGGLGVGFLALANRLGADQPSYALQSPLVEGRGLPEWSIRKMAKRRIAQIRRIQPRGPYILAGHSFGGVVAVEMAHQLVASGDRVSHLVILDSFPPDAAYMPPPPKRSLIEQAKFLGGTVALAATSSNGSMAWRLFDHANMIAPYYHGRPWPGKTLVVLADTPERAMRSVWDPFLTGKWRTVTVSGDHVTMLRSPWVDEVADHVREFLTEPV